MLEEEEQGGDDEEDLEQEALEDATGDHGPEEYPAGDGDEELGEDEGDFMEDDLGEAEVYEAFSAGWKAKAKVAWIAEAGGYVFIGDFDLIVGKVPE